MTLAGSKVDRYKFYYCEKTETCIVGLLYVGYNMAKVNNGMDTSQNKAVNDGGK